AFETGSDLADVVLEAPQARDGALVDLFVRTRHTGLGAAAHEAVEYVGARDVARARHADDLADLRTSEGALFEFGFDLPTNHALDVLDEFVDDLVRLERDALALGGLDDAAWSVDAEGEDSRVGGAGQQQVGVRRGADLG